MKTTFIRNISKSFFRQIYIGLLGLIVITYIIRVYGEEGAGTFTIALLLPTLLSNLFNLGIPASNVFFLASKKNNHADLLKANESILMTSLFLGLLLGVIIIIKFNSWFKDISPKLLWIALATYPFSLLNIYLNSIFQARQDFATFNKILIIQPTLFFMLIMISGITTKPSIAIVLLLYLLSSILTTIVLVKKINDLNLSKSKKICFAYIKRSMKYGFKSNMSNVLAFLNYKADIFLVNFYIGAAAAGVYVIAVLICEKLWIFSQATSNVLFPKLSSLSNQNHLRKNITTTNSRVIFFITAMAGIFLIPLSIFLINPIFNLDPIATTTLIVLLLPGIISSSASRVLANDLSARGRPELNMYTAFLVLAINILLNIILIPKYGLNGAAISTTLAYVFNLFIRILIYRRITKSSFIDILMIRKEDLKKIYITLHRLKKQVKSNSM